MSFVGLNIQQYHVFKYLGSGGMGDVYAAYDQRLDRKVALKAIRREHRLKPAVKARLRREARVLSGLEHPHICRIYDLLDHQDTDILVLELIEGESLKTIFGPAAAASTDLPYGEQVDRLKIAEQVASALAAAHQQGVVHRDLKPDNAMLTPRGDVKVLDFGLARRVDEGIASPPPGTLAGGEHRPEAFSNRAPGDDDTLQSSAVTLLHTELGQLAGTPAYMSPEQVLGEAITPASDMYSLGVLLQELFTGKPAYEANSLPATLIKVSRAETSPIEGVDTDLAALIERLESKEPGHRPTAVDVRDRLRWIRSRPQRRRRRTLRAATMAFLALTSAALAIQTKRIGLAAGQAEHANAGSITAREILDGDTEKTSFEISDQPLVRARLLGTISEIYRRLGLFDEALPPATEALAIWRDTLGESHHAVGVALADLAAIHEELGNFAQSRAFNDRALAIFETAPGPDQQ